MKQDVNFLLLGFLVLILCAMVGMAIYAQSEYKKLNDSYSQTRQDLEEKNAELDKKSLEINQTRTDLDTRQRELVDIVNELNISQSRENSLGGFFQNLKGEKETLQTNLNDTIKEKEKVSTDLSQTKMDLNVCRDSYKLKEDQLSKATQKINSLTNSIAIVSSSLNSSQSNLDHLSYGSGKITDAVDKLDNHLSRMQCVNNTAMINSDLQDIKSEINNINSEIASLKRNIEATEKRALGT